MAATPTRLAAVRIEGEEHPRVPFHHPPVDHHSISDLDQNDQPTSPSASHPVTPLTPTLQPKGRLKYLSIDGAGSRSYEGSIDLPTAGWVAVRARGGETVWPAADSYSFAHTSPVWIESIGSVDADAFRRSAEELMPLVDAAEAKVRVSYGDVATPRILAEFEAARVRLRGS